MRKFKHRKTGDIVEQSCEKGYYKNINIPMGTLIPGKYIEECSDWEEIITELPVGTKIRDTDTRFVYEKLLNGKWLLDRSPIIDFTISESSIGKGKRFEIIEEIPEYVKIITYGANATHHSKYTGKSVEIGKIYKVLEKSMPERGAQTMAYVLEGGYTCYCEYTKPSTKEEYEKQQQEQLKLSKEELMQECIKRFPKGSKVKCAHNGEILQIAQKFTEPGENDWFEGVYYYGTGENILAMVEGHSRGFYLYHNGKFAELVEQPKEYEILSVRKYGSAFVNGYAEATLRKNGLYLNDENSEKDGKYPLESCLKEGWKIHSIRRISDNEVFSLNETILYQNTNYTIEYFDYNNGKILVKLIGMCIGVNLSEIQKAKPLFITEDGVDFYNHEILYYVKDFMQGKCHSNSQFYHDYKNNIKLFSTKKAAENYIENHKPVLSFNDVWNISNNKSSDNNFVVIEKKKLQEIVKNKLKEGK